MSRPVRNLRHGEGAGNTGAKGKNASPKGTQAAYGGITKGDGRKHLGAGQIVRASTPRFDTPSTILNRYDGH